MNKKVCIYFFLAWFLILPFSIKGQEVVNNVAFTKLPLDNQLVARDSYDKGHVYIEGEVDFTKTPYDEIQIKVLRDGSIFNSLNQTLEYNSNIASFNFELTINAELKNYTFEVSGIKNSTTESILTVENVVAGDVYIINGQSNAEAEMKSGSSVAYLNEFIRVYGGANDKDIILTSPSWNKWGQGQGDGSEYSLFNTGQWGLTLANEIVVKQKVPVAIFNGANGGQPISFFLKDAPPDDVITNNYQRLFHRLDTTGLKQAVKAVFWSQGENRDPGTTVNSYKSSFLNLKDSLIQDYPNIEQFYIFQTKSGCSSTDYKMDIKEAQRQLAEEDPVIQIMQTTGLNYAPGEVCHFGFTNGYEEFAKRIYPLVERDIYGGPTITDMETPMITEAYLVDDTTLEVITDAEILTLINEQEALADFILDDANGSSITGIETSANKIIFHLSSDPGTNAKITFKGFAGGQNNDSDQLIENSRDIEIVCFTKYDIDASRFTIWDGNSWSNGDPQTKEFATINGDYNSKDHGSFEANTLRIKSGVTLNFYNGTNNNVIVNNDLIIKGKFKIGDTESLVMKSDTAHIEGIIQKNEKSAKKVNQYAVAYWASPVENEDLNVFTDVDENRIFTLNPYNNSGLFSGIYKHWDIASGNMANGIGYSVDGPSNGSYPNYEQEVLFTGKPNNGIINVPVSVDANDGSETGYDSNLIGNPYPSAINADSIIKQNKDLFTEAFYFWSQQNEPDGGEYQNDYITYNLSGGTGGAGNLIASGQGFVIIAKKNGNIQFNNSMRVPEDATFYKQEINKDRVWLKFTKNSNIVTEILIGFFEEATDGYDYGYDALNLSYNENKFYSVLNDRKLNIQGLGSFDKDKNISLGIDISTKDKYSIGISNLEGNLEQNDIYLVDNLLGITHDLKKEDYKFNQNKTGEFLTRFTLQFKSTALGIDDYKNDDNLAITNTIDGFKVRSSRVVNKIRVYDILGRILLETKPVKKNIELKLEDINNGTVLVIEAKLDNGFLFSKKVIKY